MLWDRSESVAETAEKPKERSARENLVEPTDPALPAAPREGSARRRRSNNDKLQMLCRVLGRALHHYKVDLEAEVIRRTEPPAVKRSSPCPAGGAWDEEDDQKQNAAGDDGGQSSSSSSSSGAGEYDGRAALRNKRMIHFGF